MMIEKVLCNSISFTLIFETCTFDFDEFLKIEREAENLALKDVENLKKVLNM